MGSGASSKKHSGNVDVISPRLETAKSDANDVVLDSAPLSDVGHGTIHYRYQLPEYSVHDTDYKNEDIQTGYFFHPKLKDYSNLTNAKNEEARKFVKVLKGPSSDQNKNVFYITGIGFNGEVTSVPKALVQKQNQSDERIFGHRYFSLTTEDNHATIGTESGNLPEKVGQITEITDEKLEISVCETTSTKELKRLLSQHYIVPISILHILLSTKEMEDDTMMADAIPNEFVRSEITPVLLSVV